MRKLIAALFVIAAGTVVAATPASAVGPSCPSGYSSSVVHTISDKARAKACFNPSTDNYKFQDIYGDGWGATLVYYNNSLTSTLNASDTDGANNGWETVNKEYAPYHQVSYSICSADFSASTTHGCTTTSAYTAP